MDRKDWSALKSAARDEQVDALRDGRKNRAVAFVNRKAENDRKACRKGNW